MYMWLLNGTVLTADPGHISGVNTTNLTIINVTVTDGGTYSCRANDAINIATSDEATLFSKFLLPITKLQNCSNDYFNNIMAFAVTLCVV